MSAWLSAFGAKRTSGEAAAWLGPTRMTQSGHRPDRNSAAQQNPARCANYRLKAWELPSATLRFRTIQVRPKDLPAALRQPEPAVNLTGEKILELNPPLVLEVFQAAFPSRARC
jgi:hypothetical protein